MKDDFIWAAGWLVFSLVLSALVVVILNGCVTMTVTAPDGATFTRSAFGINPQIGVMTVEKRADNSYRLTVRGLDSNSTDAVAGIAEGIVRGMAAAKP
jgi:hypothetical protein